MKCPANSHYEVCADNWALTCPGLTDIVLPAPECTEGCECNDGFSFDGETCIKDNKCGCTDNSKSYKVKMNLLGINTQMSFFRLCQVGSIKMSEVKAQQKTKRTCVHVCPHCNAPTHYLCSPVRWCTKTNVKRNAPVSQTKALFVKNIPALRRPNALSGKELEHAITQARQNVFTADS